MSLAKCILDEILISLIEYFTGKANKQTIWMGKYQRKYVDTKDLFWAPISAGRWEMYMHIRWATCST